MLTATELEALLKIDVKTIYTYVQKELIPYVRIQSNLRFIRKEIFDWIEHQSFQPHSTGNKQCYSGFGKTFIPATPNGG